MMFTFSEFERMRRARRPEVLRERFKKENV